MRMKMAPSLMSANLLELGNEIKALEPYADYLHVDIIDWHYVKNMCLTPQILKEVHSVTNVPIEAHLYVDNIEEDLIKTCIESGASIVTMPADVIGRSINRFAAYVHDAGAKIGVFLNPSQSIDSTIPYLKSIDLLLILAADPGYGGQSFLPDTYERIRRASQLRQEHHADFEIEIDGNCEESKFEALRRAGADVLALGRGCFGRSSRTAEAARLTRDSLLEVESKLALQV